MMKREAAIFLSQYFRTVRARCWTSANGPVRCTQAISMNFKELGDMKTDVYLMQDTPPLLSIGQRVVHGTYSFLWLTGFEPCIVTPRLRVIPLISVGDCPYFNKGGPHETLTSDEAIAAHCGVYSTGKDLCITAFATKHLSCATKEVDPTVCCSATREHDSDGSTDAGPESAAVSSAEEESDEAMVEYLAEDIETDDASEQGIDPNPKHEDDSGDDRPVRRDLRAESRTIKHLLRHKLGFGCSCDTCMRGKTKRKPRRQRKSKADPSALPEEFGELVTCDHVLMHDWWGRPGCGGSPDMFNIFDVGTGYKYSEGVYSKDTLETYRSIQFMRGKDHIHHMYPDNF